MSTARVSPKPATDMNTKSIPPISPYTKNSTGNIGVSQNDIEGEVDMTKPVYITTKVPETMAIPSITLPATPSLVQGSQLNHLSEGTMYNIPNIKKVTILNMPRAKQQVFSAEIGTTHSSRYNH